MSNPEKKYSSGEEWKDKVDIKDINPYQDNIESTETQPVNNQDTNKRKEKGEGGKGGKNKEKLEGSEESVPDEMYEGFWNKLGRKTEERIVDYKEENGLILSDERKEHILNTLDEEGNDKLQEVAQEWASSHKDELKEKGLEGGDPVKLFSQWVKEEYGSNWGAFLRDASKEGEDFGDKVRDYINIFATSRGFEKNPDNPDNQYGALYFLQRKTERLEKELKGARKEEDKKKIRTQLDELYKDQSELIKGIKGLDIAKDTKKGLSENPNFVFKPKPGGEIEFVINRALSDIKEENKDKSLKDRVSNIVDKLGYKITERKGFIRRRLEIIDDKGKKLTWPGSKKVIGRLNGFVYELLLDRYKEKLTREQGIKYMCKERTKGETKKIIESLDEGEGGIDSLYGRIKDKLVIDFVNNNLLKRGYAFLSLTERRKLREKFEGKGKSDIEFVEGVKGEIGKLKGNWENDVSRIVSFCNKYAGTDLDENDLRGNSEIEESYKKLFKRKEKVSLGKFLDFTLGKLIFPNYEESLK